MASLACVVLLGASAFNHTEQLPPIRGSHNRINRLRRQRGVQQVTDRPNTIRDAERGGRRGAQRLVNAAEIVMRT